MLNDGYAEHIVKTKTPGGIIAVMVLGLLISVFGVAAILATGGGFSFILIGAVVFSLAFSRRETEFEYLMVNEDIEVAKIIAKKSRKKMFSFSNSEVRYIVSPDSIYLDNEVRAGRNTQIKTRDYTSRDKNEKENVYVFVINRSGAAEFVYLELSDRTLDHVNNFFKGKYKE